MARVTRACRLTLTIRAVKNLRKHQYGPLMKEPTFRMTLEGKSRKTSQISGKPNEDGIQMINQSFTFDVKNWQNSALVVEVIGKCLLGTVSLGHCKQIPIPMLLRQSSQYVSNELKDDWYDLYSEDGTRMMPGKVLMHIVASEAEPEQKINIFIGTWNVGNSPPGNNLSDWLPTTPSYDIIAIGAQECDYVPRAPHADCTKDWMASLKSVIGDHYKVVDGLSRGQMRLAVFVRDNAQKAISEILNGTEATGVGHVIHNKGAVCIAFKFWDTSLCFVNCHLAAHEGQCEARNGNYREIIDNIRINDQNMDILHQFHHVFWFGDLNYRLGTKSAEDDLNAFKVTWESVNEKIQQRNFNDLLKYDELRNEQEAKRVLYKFKEGEITFPPTFKTVKGEETTYARKRIPAWCDRILWFSLPGFTLEQLSYNSAPSVCTSDHKPVYATFTLTAHALPAGPVDKREKDEERWHIRFTDLRAKGLTAADIAGSSDPYVTFLGPNLHEELHTKVIFQDLNPVWKPKDIPTVVFTTTEKDRLEKEFLIVRVTDFDYTSLDDTLGYGVIPLAEAVAASGSKGEVSFNIDLSHCGCPAGTLAGTMSLTSEKYIKKKKFCLANSFIEKTISLKRDIKRRMVSNRMV